MKLMYFLDHFQILGGAAHTLLRQSALMKKAGEQVLVVVPGSREDVCADYIRFCENENIRILFSRYRIATQPEDIDILSVMECFGGVLDLIKKYQPDILHSVQLNPTVELAARILGIPHVMNIYPLIPDFFKIAYEDIFPGYHICDSEYYAERWRKYWHTESVCIRVSTERVEHAVEKILYNHEIRFICVGGIDARKNQLNVIKAFHKALRNGLCGRLDIYGYFEATGYGKECLDYIMGQHLEERVSLKGFCDDMSRAYREADVLICGSTRESYPNVIAEALANGLAVISTPVAGVPEIIRDGGNGYLCSGYGDDAILEKIMELKKDCADGSVSRILRGAKETYEKVHSPEVVTEKLKQYYHCLMKEYRGKEIVSIESLRELFRQETDIYYENEKYFSCKEAVSGKLWYIHHIRKAVERLMEEGKKFYIWGAGKYGRCAYEIASAFFEGMRVEGFIDAFKTGEYMGKQIFSPDKVLKGDNNVVFVAVFDKQMEVTETLKKYHRNYAEDYFILAPRYW